MKSTLPILLVSLLAPWPALAHGGMEDSPPAAIDLGSTHAGELMVSANVELGERSTLGIRVTRMVDPPDPLLGGAAPATGLAPVATLLLEGRVVAGPIAMTAEGPAGAYEADAPHLGPGKYALRIDFGSTKSEFALEVPDPEAALGHHAMAHPFLTHMGIPDGPGEASVRLTYLARANGAQTGTDLAFHVEAGIVPRLGLHLRNDAIAGAASGEAGHGTELMLMYALAQDKAATRGISVFAEAAVPTPQGDGPPITAAAGIGARYMWRTRLLLDGIVHVDPMDGLDHLGAEYEASAQVRVAGRVFLIVEDSGEAGSMGSTNYLLPAVKVGLGHSGATIGAGAQFALTAERAWDRQASFQLDWAF